MHQIGAVAVEGRAAYYPSVPTVMSTSTTTSAPTGSASPDAARSTWLMWLPDWAMGRVPLIGETVIGEASVDSGAPVTYFAGVVDEVRIGRRRPGAAPTVERMSLDSVKVTLWPTGEWFGVTYTSPTPGIVSHRVEGDRLIVTVDPRTAGADSKEGTGRRRRIEVKWRDDRPPGTSTPGRLIVPGVPTLVDPMDVSTASDDQFMTEVCTATASVGNGDHMAASVPLAANATVVETGAGTWPYRVDSTLDVKPEPGPPREVVYAFPYVVTPVADGARVGGSFVRLECSDYIAPAGRLRIGDTPYPFEDVEVRWNKVADLCRARGLPAYTSSSMLHANDSIGWWWYYSGVWGGNATGQVRPLDIDSRSALDVLRRTAAASGQARVISRRGGIGYQPRPTAFYVIDTTATPYRKIDGPDVTTIPSSAVKEVPRVLSAASTVNQVEVEMVAVAADGVTTRDLTVIARDGDAVARRGPYPQRIESDAAIAEASASNPSSHIVYARAVADLHADPIWTLEESVSLVGPDLATATGLARLIDVDSRVGQAVRLSGALPWGMGRDWRVREVSFTVGDDSEAIRVVLDPAAYLRITGLLLHDGEDLTLGGMAAITFGETPQIGR